MITLTRPDIAAQSPSGESYLAGVFASVALFTLASSPLPCRNSRTCEFSVKITSAGDLVPSAAIWLARTSSSSLRTWTVMPVAFSNWVTSASVVCTCWPL